MMLFRGGYDPSKMDSGLDQEEAVLSFVKGANSEPWHPAEMKAPYIYKLCLIGPCEAGKSSIAHRLVAHTFDPTYRATRVATQLFWRHVESTTGQDIMFELEDTPGVFAETTESGELLPQGLSEVKELLRPLLWFEKRRKDQDGKKAVVDERTALMPDGKPRITGAVGGKKKKDSWSSWGAAVADQVYSKTASAFGGSTSSKANPIGEDRKRLGFVIVADLSSEKSFEAAHAIVDRIFDRLQFDSRGDPMSCPVSVIIVGNKSERGGMHRAMPEEEELRREIQSRYENPRAEPKYNVLYVECSARTNTGLEEVMLQSLERIRQLPTRHRIRTSRLRTTGYFAQLKRKLYHVCPWCFDLEECCKVFKRQVLNPACAKLGLYQTFCECKPLKAVGKEIGKLWTRFLTFRWLCDWCPPFILRYKKEVTSAEDEADLDKEEQEQREADEAAQDV